MNVKKQSSNEQEQFMTQSNRIYCDQKKALSDDRVFYFAIGSVYSRFKSWAGYLYLEQLEPFLVRLAKRQPYQIFYCGQVSVLVQYWVSV